MAGIELRKLLVACMHRVRKRGQRKGWSSRAVPDLGEGTGEEGERGDVRGEQREKLGDVGGAEDAERARGGGEYGGAVFG